ncbi:TonB-dependent receptor [Aliifodinibius sp. S!AR15-10]|uniref:SusC/RagA family TonB-linked outer membrane protein n=1 Tax=Aliifodinibius sp. S!AR15-10 TaxID=2950437 RepID=UPI00286733BB|nr:TonB-dependent receptor [Aliifodinibius sp. S!AR15-10]MDR8393574.1 TonB-dependent receptor [Aliifodinibius sp. S!AR15-10]
MKLPKYFLKILQLSVLAVCLAFPVTGSFAQETESAPGEGDDVTRIEPNSPEFMQVSVSLQLKEVPLRVILNELEKQADVFFSYRDKLWDDKQLFAANFENISLGQALRIILENRGIDIVPLSGRYIVLKEKNKHRAGEGEAVVTGQVIDANTGRKLIGANVTIIGGQEGTSTNAEGRFIISELDPAGYTLSVSYLGYAEIKKKVVARAGDTTDVNFHLQPEPMPMDELVVVGYGVQSRSDVTGSIASVDADEIVSVTPDGVQEALQGRAAGVLVTSSTGQPGAPVDINIRGISTFGNNSPMFVIDGVPVVNSGGGTINPMATLNPENIESVEILKDASASAIYGARAANGVVIVTTKSGQPGETEVSFHTYRGISRVNNTIDMMNSRQYTAYARDAYQAVERSMPISLQEPLLSENLKQDTDWQKAAFDRASIQNYTFTISGGNENNRYAFTGGYYNKEGTMPSSGFERYSARINTDFTIADRFRVGESIEFSRGIWTGTFNPSTDIMQELLQQSPTVPVYNPDNLGGFAGPTIERSPVNRSNQVGVLTLVEDETVQNRILGRVFAEYEFLPGLSYRLNVGGNILYDESKNFIPRYEMGNRSNNKATLTENRRSENTFLIENTLTYQQSFANKHDIKILAGYTQQNAWLRNMTGVIDEFPNNEVRTISAGFGQTNLSGDESGWALRSQIGRVNYTYDDKYSVMASIRRDGTSRFGEKNRYGIFPAISASWLITGEPFMDISWLSYFKLRASWGEVGNQEISDFASYTTIEPGARYILGEDQELVPGATHLELGSSDLKWETTTQVDVGLDLMLLNDKLSFVFDYYWKDTRDMLIRLPVHTTSGIRRNNGPFQNAGSVINSGIEVTAEFRDNIGAFDYRLSGNFSTFQNEVTELGSGEPVIAQVESDPNYATTITREGGQVGLFYGYVMEGIFRDQADVQSHATQPGAAPGDVKFKDLNNDGSVDAKDQTVIGSPFPDFYYGFNFNLAYKNFDLGVFLQGVQGHEIFNLVWAGINDGEGDNNATTTMLDRWTPNNRDTDVPRAVNGDPNRNFRPSTRFIGDGSYLRIKNIQLGYSLGPSLLERINLSSARLYIAAKNLHTFTGYRSYNPEVGTLSSGIRSSLTRGIDFGTYPIPMSIHGGLQVSFN